MNAPTYLGTITGAELARLTRRDLMWEAARRALEPYHLAILAFTACLAFGLGIAFAWWLAGLEPASHAGGLRGSM